MRFLASSVATAAALGSAQIFSAGQFIARVIDDFIGTQMWCGVRAKARDLRGNNHGNE
jgi:hypothetical protein